MELDGKAGRHIPTYREEARREKMKSFSGKVGKSIKLNQSMGHQLEQVWKRFLKLIGVAHEDHSATDEDREEIQASESKSSSDFRKPERPSMDPGQGGQHNSSIQASEFKSSSDFRKPKRLPIDPGQGGQHNSSIQTSKSKSSSDFRKPERPSIDPGQGRQHNSSIQASESKAPFSSRKFSTISKIQNMKIFNVF